MMNIIITGASRGLGYAMAEKFAEHGHDLYLCSQNEVSLYQALEKLTARFPDVKIKAKAFDLSRKHIGQRNRFNAAGVGRQPPDFHAASNVI